MTDDEFITWLRRQNKPDSRAMEQRFYGDPARYIKYESEKGMKMGKLAIVTTKDTFSERDPIDRLLDIWASYMTLRDTGVSSGHENPQDVKDFMTLGEAVEVMVNDLRRHQWWAVRKSRGICTQWIFKDVIYESALLQAKEILEKKMRGNIACARYFR